MSLMHAYQTLLENSRPADRALGLEPPVEALVHLVDHAEERGILATSHPWELDPRVCRELEESAGFAPAGGWARLAGLSAGAGVLHATPEGFQSLATPKWIRGFDDGFRQRMVEGFTMKLIPPAAAAALYVSLGVHPIWGLRLGRDVGACEMPPGDHDERGLDAVRRIVFGTISGILVTLRGLSVDRAYPVDALGEVLWWSAVAARTSVSATSAAAKGLPVFVEGAIEERRMLTTRMAITDLLDFVFVPAGVGRRSDSGWFTIDPSGVALARAGNLQPGDQQELFALLCDLGGQAA